MCLLITLVWLIPTYPVVHSVSHKTTCCQTSKLVPRLFTPPSHRNERYRPQATGGAQGRPQAADRAGPWAGGPGWSQIWPHNPLPPSAGQMEGPDRPDHHPSNVWRNTAIITRWRVPRANRWRHTSVLVMTSLWEGFGKVLTFTFCDSDVIMCKWTDWWRHDQYVQDDVIVKTFLRQLLAERLTFNATVSWLRHRRCAYGYQWRHPDATSSSMSYWCCSVQLNVTAKRFVHVCHLNCQQSFTMRNKESWRSSFVQFRCK